MEEKTPRQEQPDQQLPEQEKNAMSQPPLPRPLGPGPCRWSAIHVALTLVLSLLLSFLPYWLFGRREDTIGVDLISFTLQIGCFALLPMYFAARFQLPREALALNRPSLADIGAGLLWGAALFGINTGLSWLTQAILPEAWLQGSSAIQMLDAGGSPGERVVLILFLVALSPAAEELFFRAFMLPPLLDRFSPLKAMLWAGAIFSLIHFSLAGFLSLLAGGFGFCLLYYRRRNIFVNITAHATWNLIALILYFVIS